MLLPKIYVFKVGLEKPNKSISLSEQGRQNFENFGNLRIVIVVQLSNYFLVEVPSSCIFAKEYI